MGTCLRFMFPDGNLRANFAAGLSKDSSPRPAMLNFLLYSHSNHNSVKHWNSCPSLVSHTSTGPDGSLAEVGDSYFGCLQRIPWDFFCIVLLGVVDPEPVASRIIGHSFLFNVTDYFPGILSPTNHIPVGCWREVSNLVGVMLTGFPHHSPLLFIFKSLKAES